MSHQRSYRTLASAVLLLALIQGCAWRRPGAPSPVVGTWVNRVGTVWTIKQDGTFDVDLTRDGQRDAWGKYSIDGETITLNAVGGITPKDCTGPGVYRFKRSGPELTFTVVHDSCKLRKRNVLLGWRLKR